MKKKKLIFTTLFTLTLTLTTLSGCKTDNSSKTVNKVMIGTKPDKLDYEVGEYFDPTGMVLVVRYVDGSTGTVTSGYTWDITSPLEEDDDEIMITYKYKSALLDININIKNPTSIVVKQMPTKTTYVVGDKFDPTGMILTGTYEDGTTEDYETGYRYSKASIKTTDYQWKITYNRASCYVPINVVSPRLDSIYVDTPPSKTIYDEGEYFSADGVVIKGNYPNGDTVQIVDYSYSPNTPLTRDVTKITFEYNELTCEYPITVNAVSLLIRLKTMPTKTEYVAGEEFDPTGMEVEKVENGVVTTLNSTQYTILGGARLAVGSTLLVKLLGVEENVTAKIPVYVSNEIDLETSHLIKSSGSTAGYATNLTLKATATNGNYLINFAENDVLNITFKSQSSGKAKLFIKSASTYVTEYSSASNKTWYYPTKTGNVQANKLFDVYMNDVKVVIPDSVIFEGSETEDPNGDVLLLAVWKNVEMNNVDVKQGINTIQIKFLKQIYKNADVTVDNKTKTGVLSSPVMDTITIKYDTSTSVRTATDGEEEVEYVYSASESNGVLTVTKTSIDGSESVTKTVNTSTVGVLKNNEGYNSGDDNYYDLGSANIIGSNDIDGITDSFAKDALNAKGDRGTAVVQSSGSKNVEKALNKACGHDYLSYFYNGAGVEVSFNATQEETKMIVIKAASGYMVGNAFCTANMQFNLIFDVSINNENVPMDDDVILYGKDGNGDYGVAHANWTYIVFEVDVSIGENVIQLISKAPYDANGNVLYYDVSRTKNNTMSSAKIDSIAVI